MHFQRTHGGPKFRGIFHRHFQKRRLDLRNDEMLAVLTHKPNVSYELHGWGPRQYPPALKKAIAGRLTDRIIRDLKRLAAMGAASNLGHNLSVVRSL